MICYNGAILPLSPFSLAVPVIRLNAVQIKKIILDFCIRNTAEYECKVRCCQLFARSALIYLQTARKDSHWT